MVRRVPGSRALLIALLCASFLQICPSWATASSDAKKPSRFPRRAFRGLSARSCPKYFATSLLAFLSIAQRERGSGQRVYPEFSALGVCLRS